MTKGQRTITTLLAAIVVLLAINLVVIAPGQEAQAQGMGRPPQAVALTVRNEFFSWAAYRLWSDGTVERNEVIVPPLEVCLPVEWCGWQTIPEPPFVR